MASEVEPKIPSGLFTKKENRMVMMRPELSRFLSRLWAPDDAKASLKYSNKIAALSFQLEKPHRLFVDGASRQIIPASAVEELVNGRARFLQDDPEGGPAMLYAGARGEGSWISVGVGGTRVTYFLVSGEKPTCVLQERESPGRWKDLQVLGEVDWKEVDTVVAFGEKIVLR